MTNREHIFTRIKTKMPELTHLGVNEIGIFGSYARDEQTESSDIDILIDFETGKETFDNLLSVWDILEQLFENHRIEVITKKGLSPYIGPKILKEVQYVEGTH